jgi:hypothetical protein
MITKSFDQSIPHHSCHAIITCDIHNACFLRPFPLIPRWIPSIIMDTKIYWINSYEIPENKNKNKIVVMYYLLQCPLNFDPFNHMLAMGIHGLMSFKGMLVIACKTQCTYSWFSCHNILTTNQRKWTSNFVNIQIWLYWI